MSGMKPSFSCVQSESPKASQVITSDVRGICMCCEYIGFYTEIASSHRNVQSVLSYQSPPVITPVLTINRLKSIPSISKAESLEISSTSSFI